MRNENETQRITENLEVIREYLKAQFKEFNLTEDQTHGSLYHKFTVVKLKPQVQYKLKVAWKEISDNSPTNIKPLLVNDKVAARMRAAKGDYFSWGWH